MGLNAQLVEQLELPGTRAGWVKPTWEEMAQLGRCAKRKPVTHQGAASSRRGTNREPKKGGHMDDITKKPYAAWLEEALNRATGLPVEARAVPVWVEIRRWAFMGI